MWPQSDKELAVFKKYIFHNIFFCILMYFFLLLKYFLNIHLHLHSLLL
jgi:hypothetical protein